MPNYYSDYRARGANIKARRLGIEGTISGAQLIELFLTQGGICVYCSKLLGIWYADHIFPMSRGGSNWIENIQLLCKTCNEEKCALMPGEYMAVLTYRAAQLAQPGA